MNESLPLPLASLIKNADDCEWTYFTGEEGREDRLRWKILIGDGKSNTKGLTFGIFEVPQGQSLEPHYHVDHEIYYIQQGKGDMLIDKKITAVGSGSVIYIPGNVAHGIRNTSEQRLILMWMFPNDTWNEIKYQMVDQ